jgi:hypothetical protein
MLAELARRRLKEWKPEPAEPPTAQELESLRHYLDPATFEQVAQVTATTPAGVDWFEELESRIGAGMAARVAAAMLEAYEDERRALARSCDATLTCARPF